MKRVETDYIRGLGPSVMICWGINGDVVECAWVMRMKKPRKS